MRSHSRLPWFIASCGAVLYATVTAASFAGEGLTDEVTLTITTWEHIVPPGS